MNGGIFQAAVNIDAGGGFEFEEEQGFLGSTGLWESTFNPNFDHQLKGILNGNGYSVFAQTGIIKPGAFQSQVTTIGSTGWSLLYSGKFKYLNGAPRIDVTGIASENLIAFANSSGGIGARSPDSVIGCSLVFIPEPTTSIIAGLGMLGIVAAYRTNKTRK